MATMTSRDTRTFEAGGDLSADQFKFVALAADGQVELCGAGAQAIGVLLNDPAAAGRAATVVVSGDVMVKCGGTVTRGGAVAVDASGLAVDATTGDVIMGYAREAGVASQIINIELIQGGNASA